MERNYNLDLIKVMAMIGVIGLHSFSIYMNDSVIADMLYRACTISIPLFFMVSGWLMSSKSIVNYEYISKKILSILKFVGIIVFAYFMLYSIYSRTFEINNLYKTYFQSLFQQGPFWHLWYLGAMIIIYICAPLLYGISTKGIKQCMILCLICIAVCSFIFALNITRQIETNIIQTLRIWNWLTYFSLGMLLQLIINTTNHIIHINTKSTIILIICVLGGVILSQLLLIPFIGDRACEYFYSSLPVIFLSTAVFYVSAKVDIPFRLKSVIVKLSPLFLPVYFFHRFILSAEHRIMEYVSIDNATLSSILLFLSVVISSIAFSYIIMKIRVIRNMMKL